MADIGFIRNGLPVASTVLQDGLDFGVQRFVHAGIIVKNSLKSKEHFTKPLGHPQPMTEKPLPINEVVAENLGYLMRQAGMTQAALAEKAGVSQKTISNYLNPAQRSDNTSGKQPSPKLVELDQIATALDVRVWELTRQMTPQERRMYEAIEKAYRELRDTVEKGGASDIHQPALPGSKDEQGNSAYSDEAGSAGKNGLSVVKRASGRPLPPALDREDAIHRGDGNYDDEGSTDRAAPKPAKNPRGRR